MVQHNTGPGTANSRTMSEIESNLGTMVINDSEHNTMKQVRREKIFGIRIILFPVCSTALLLVSRITLRTSCNISTRRM